MARKSQTELELLEQSRVALENATTNPEIAALLAEVGYDAAKIQQGKDLLDKAQHAYDNNKQENVETSLAYDTFDREKQKLEALYRNHRRRAKVVLEGKSNFLLRLDIHRPITKTYLGWMDSTKRFYSEALANSEIKTELRTLKITEQDLLNAQSLITTIEGLRQTYINEKGESQDATKRKDHALKDLDQWMRNFYAVAGIALEDQPQLMESLGKLVKS